MEFTRNLLLLCVLKWRALAQPQTIIFGGSDARIIGCAIVNVQDLTTTLSALAFMHLCAQFETPP